MKPAVRIVQFFVGVLFIVSGLVKANDPIGLGYKMQEFFELWNAGFPQGSFLHSALTCFHDASLPLSIFMITLEILAGVALLLGWKKKFIIWLLLLLIIFFTFLTGYAYLSGKFTNCGCFGDCLPITPLTSFLKDLALFLMTVFLLFGQRYIRPVFSPRLRAVLLGLGLLLSLGLQWYVLAYLPIADCLPFKKGNDIAAQMKPPANAVADSTATYLVYEKGGKRYEWLATEIPADYQTYKYKESYTKLLRQGNNRPRIEGFSLKGISGADSTQVILEQKEAVLVFAMDFKDSRWIKEIKTLITTAKEQGVPLYMVCIDAQEGAKALSAEGISDVQFVSPDYVNVRIVARTTPTILILNKGVIVQKYSRREISKAVAAVAAP